MSSADGKTWSEVSGASLSEQDAGTLAELELPSVLDADNATLLDNVHPRCHVDPDPTDVVYDLVALGAGAGGLVSAKQCSRRGGRSALIEQHLHGGDCLNVGCVPSKALIGAARRVRAAKGAAAYGVGVGEVTVDFPFIMQRMRSLRARISPADAVSATSTVGADVFQGRGVFTGPHTVVVNGKTLHFKKAVVASGGSPTVPPIPGLREVPYLTNRTLFNLTSLPPRMTVIGAGPIGLEMAQCFALFGAEVTVLDVAPKVLAREDQDAAKVIEQSVRADGVKFDLGIKNLRFKLAKAAEGGGLPTVTAEYDDAEGVAVSLDCEALLCATGRAPNVEGLGLKEAGVEYEKRTGVAVNDQMQTSNPDIYAVGDCSTKWQFTHMAGTQAQMVVDNAVFGDEKKVSELVIPRCTYTTPEVAGTGASEQELTDAGTEFDTYTSQLQHNDRAILEGSDEGFCKLLVAKGSGEILGGTIVAENAGDMISEVTLAIQVGIELGGIARTIHPYPTVAECIAGCAFQYKAKHWQTKDNKHWKKSGGRPTFRNPDSYSA